MRRPSRQGLLPFCLRFIAALVTGLPALQRDYSVSTKISSIFCCPASSCRILRRPNFRILPNDIKILLLLSLVVSALGVTGQRPYNSRNMGSYIIGKQKDTLYVNFILPKADVMPFGDTLWMQDKVIIADGDQSLELLPDQLSGFCYNGYYYETLQWAENTLATPRLITRKFCKRILSGPISVFACNEVMPAEDGYVVKAVLYYKQDDEYKPASQFNFQCPVSGHKLYHRGLAQKVKSGNFRRDDFLAIIQEYNQYLEPKTSH